MGRRKKQLKVKEPVHIRERKLASGNTSLYLDIYKNGVRKYESLGLYLIPSTSPDAKILNARTRSIAERIKNDRVLALMEKNIKELYGSKKSKIALIVWLKTYESDSSGFREMTLQGRRDLRRKMEEYLMKEGLSHITMDEVDADFCRGFLQFLKTARNGVCKKQKGRTISNGCALHHQAVFNGALNKAVRDGIIPANPLKRLERREKFHPSPEEREYLTIDEIKILMDAPCVNLQVKKAFLFSCFTGLRLSDVRSLTWSNIHQMPDGKSLFVHMVMRKTQKGVDVPLSEMALQYLDRKKAPDQCIFSLPASNSAIGYVLRKWVKAGNINKKITFHCSRHTFATMMLTMGADLYTTSKLLGHGNVATTQIYSKIIDKKKVDAVNLVNTMFQKSPSGVY